MHRPFLRASALLGALAVALGAFGAHGLRGKVSDLAVSTFETAVRYHFYHVVALAIVAIACRDFNNKWIRWSGNMFMLGILLFSGSLYALTFILAAENTALKWIGAITPIGGLAFIAGWLCLFFGVKRNSV